jgi:DNA-binding transcriptional LysR family regulator
MELRHMRYFVAVAEHLHFGRAADALATAQPSLSRQIQQLEEELGAQLFERANKRVVLTAAGRMFLTDANRILQLADASVRHARENAEGTRGELRIGFIGGAMMMEMPLVLSTFRQRFPQVELVPYAMHNEHVAALADGRVDIAWTVPPAHPEFGTRNITSDRLSAALPANHPLAAAERVDLTDFADEPLITLAPSVGPLLRDTAIELALRHGYRPSRLYEVNDEITALGFVAAGFGVGLIPHSWSVIHIPGIVYRPLTVDLQVRQMLCWRLDSFTPLVRSFVETASEVLSPAKPLKKTS